MRLNRVCLSIPVLLALNGCLTAPPFDLASMSSKDVPTASDVIDHVQCEIWSAIRDTADARLQPMRDDEYIVYVDVTLEVTDNEGANPNLAFILPYAKAGESFSGGALGQYNQIQDRTFTQSFTLDLKYPLSADQSMHAARICGKSFFTGNLGIREIMTQGLEHEGASTFVFSPVIPANGDSNQYMYNNNSLFPAFGSTVDFQIAYGAGLAPQWTLTKFAGPSGSGGGSFVNGSRTWKDSLIVSFAPVGKVSPALAKGLTPSIAGQIRQAAEVGARLSAGQAAQYHATQMILQQILP